MTLPKHLIALLLTVLLAFGPELAAANPAAGSGCPMAAMMDHSDEGPAKALAALCKATCQVAMAALAVLPTPTPSSPATFLRGESVAQLHPWPSLPPEAPPPRA